MTPVANRIGLAVLLALLPWSAEAARVKDLVEVSGVRDNQLVGVGLVVGLNRTGDSGPFLAQALSNAFKRLGLQVSPSQAKSKNAAVVYVTATLPPFARPGAKIDVTVSSVGDAKSLFGGTLLRTPLSGADREVYAIAQGQLAVGGFTFGGKSSSEQRNHPTVGRVPSGALVERISPSAILGRGGELTLCLRRRSFAVASRIARKIREELPVAAVAEDGATVRVSITPAQRLPGRLVSLIARIGSLEVKTDTLARIVINERTGTIVAGEHVRLGRVVISHGNLSVSISESASVSQPRALAKGQTKVVPETKLRTAEGSGALQLVAETVTVADLARALNALGVSPRDLVSIFQALRVAGALEAELVVM
ncbi:MAG: flagellar basal body P-ring protein FlgI [Planctomycetes bacterium]|nr:flagellar basal body P-ring protein FlgI [Planctomycetota bacterium]